VVPKWSEKWGNSAPCARSGSKGEVLRVAFDCERDVRLLRIPPRVVRRCIELLKMVCAKVIDMQL
jgi:hypothetical protein